VSDIIENKLLSTKAYQLFRVELLKHLNSFEDHISKATAGNTSEYKRLSASFHTIRGGSGFFGLDKIAEISGKLEELLGDDNFDFSEDFEKAKELFKILKEESKKVLEG